MSDKNAESATETDGPQKNGEMQEAPPPPPPPVARHNPFLGFFYLLLASVMYSAVSVIVKKLSYIDSSQLSLALNAGNFVFSLPIAVYSSKEVIGAKENRKLLLLRGFSGGTALYLFLVAYAYLPIAEAAVVMSATPAATTLAACVLLKERSGGVQIASLVIAVCGVLTSVRLPQLLNDSGASRFDYYYAVGLAAAVGFVATFSVTIVALRKMKGVHFSVSMLYYGFFGTIEIGVINAASATYASPNCGWDPLLYFLIPALGFLANCLVTMATQVEAAGIVSVVKASTDMIMAMVFQVLFFGVSPDAYNAVGASLVIVAVGLLGIRNWLLTLPEEAKARKRLKCFLY